MAIQFDCPYCTSTLKVPDETAGKQGDCPRCGTKLVIPNPFTAEAQPPTQKEPTQSAPQQQPVEQTSNTEQTVDQTNDSPPASIQPAPMTSATSRYLRRRKKSNWGGIVLFLFFFSMMLGVAFYFYWIYGPRLEGSLVAARLNSQSAKLEQRLKPAGLGLSDDVIQSVNQHLNETPRRVKSDLMDLLFYGSEKGGLYVRLKPGDKTELVRVELTGDSALMDYISKNGVQLDQPRLAEYQSELKQFYTDWQHSLETGEDVHNLINYRNTVGLNSLMGGLGYHMEARVNNKIYPCVHDDFQGGLYFLVPKGTLQFEMTGRELKSGRTPFPGKYQVQVTQEYPSAP
ncbi:hypothetical protein [Gimesia aquarii]|uniref:Uncharacterized protein n=1 Tax=Gimesia aquarii TaxID=2527964 RepID=A0A517VTC3_9PLAN|nr:hypothetical protein [Gimesia aquarii]QDT96209.1 hypothetical protein V144x_16620 [Gimesia aquarii]